MSTATAEPTAKAAEATFRFVPLDKVNESPMNPRKYFNPERLLELELSIREKGVLTPLLVRPHPALRGEFEIAAGHRRRRAAELAGVAEVPVLVREMDDTAFLEVLVVENDQRDDVHPLEEAAGYRALMLQAHFTVERLAERVGRSTKYIYDRIKLLALGPKAQELFMAGHITAGHAILLARLTPADQLRAIGIDPEDAEQKHIYPHGSGLYVIEGARLFDSDPDLDLDGLDEDEDAYGPQPGKGLKLVSVRELQAWIDKHVRFEAAAPDPMLFPEAAAAVSAAVEVEQKVVHITRSAQIQPEAKADGQRTYGPQSWKRADDVEGGACQYAAIGVVVVGPGRGEAFPVCIAKKKCDVHWKEEREAKSAPAAAGRASAQDTYAEQQRRYREQEERAEAERKRWERARPAILETTAARLKNLPVRPGSELADLVLRFVSPPGGVKGISGYIGAGRTAEDLLRYAAFIVLYRELAGWDAPRAFLKVARPLGIDVEAALEGAAPPAGKTVVKDAGAKKPKPAKKKAAPKAKAKKASKR